MCNLSRVLVDQGIEQGMKQGVEKEKMSLAQMMIEEKEPADKISKYTGYAIDKLKEIAGFISRKWFPVFANYRRDGYDFDALFEDEKAPYKHKKIMDFFMEENQDSEIFSNLLKVQAGFGKDGEKGFDGAVTSLMMQTYLCTCDFRKRVNKNGKEYGWDVAVYSSPEHIYGYNHIASRYQDNRTGFLETDRAAYARNLSYCNRKTDSENIKIKCILKRFVFYRQIFLFYSTSVVSGCNTTRFPEALRQITLG